MGLKIMPFLFPKVKRMMLIYRDPDQAYKKLRKLLSLKLTAYVTNKSLEFFATFASGSRKGVTHETVIQFFELNISLEKLNKQHVSIDQDGKTYYHAIPSIKVNPARISCTCEDFRFSFEKQNYDSGGLIGDWRRYKRKTPPKVRPANAKNPNPIGRDFVNAKPDGGDNVTGYCVHLHSLLKELYSSGKVKN